MPIFLQRLYLMIFLRIIDFFMGQDQAKLEYVDLLKGVAIILVVVIHTSIIVPVTHFNPYVQRIVTDSARGVQLFFILSSFSIFYSLNKGTVDWKKFFLKRIIRIYPLWLLAIMVYLVINGLGPRYWLGDVPKITITNIAFNVLLIHGLYPYFMNSVVDVGWFISIQFMLYLLVPFFYKKCTSLSNSIKMLGIFYVLGKIITLLLKRLNPISSLYMWDNFLFLYLPIQIPSFILGIVAFYLIVKKDYRLRNIDLIIVAILLFSCYLKIDYIFEMSILLFLVLIIFSVLKINNYVTKILSYIGRLSYGIYLSHFIFIIVIQKYELFNGKGYLDFLLVLGIILLLSIIVAFPIFELLEKPLYNRIKSSFEISKRKEKEE